MKRELGQPIMSHDNPFVDDPAEVLDGLDKPKRPGEIEVDLTSVAEALVSTVGSLNRGRERLINNARSGLAGVFRNGKENYGPSVPGRARRFATMIKFLHAGAS